MRGKFGLASPLFSHRAMLNVDMNHRAKRLLYYSVWFRLLQLRLCQCCESSSSCGHLLFPTTRHNISLLSARSLDELRKQCVVVRGCLHNRRPCLPFFSRQKLLLNLNLRPASPRMSRQPLASGRDSHESRRVHGSAPLCALSVYVVNSSRTWLCESMVLKDIQLYSHVKTPSS